MQAKKQKNKGSSLIAVIIITVVSITVIGAMVILVSLVLLSTLGWQRSTDAIFAAESYVDDYTLKLVRNPNTTPGQTIEGWVNGSAITPVLYGALDGKPNVLFVTAEVSGYSRTIRLIYTVENGGIKILDRGEVSE